MERRFLHEGGSQTYGSPSDMSVSLIHRLFFVPLRGEPEIWQRRNSKEGSDNHKNRRRGTRVLSLDRPGDIQTASWLDRFAQDSSFHQTDSGQLRTKKGGNCWRIPTRKLAAAQVQFSLGLTLPLTALNTKTLYIPPPGSRAPT